MMTKGLDHLQALVEETRTDDGPEAFGKVEGILFAVAYIRMLHVRTTEERLREALEKIVGYMKSDPDTTSTRFVLHVAREALEASHE